MADHPKQESPIRLQGNLLIADPSLGDGIFRHSVILLTEHTTSSGAHGLILNHPSGHKVGEFLKEEEFSPLARIDVHVGGPVSSEHLTFAALWWSEENTVEIVKLSSLTRSRAPAESISSPYFV